MNLSLADVPAKYRPAPFWSWNDLLDPEELRRQIREMHRVGLGGFFMHARGGLRTAYLSDEWMACVEASIDEAQKLGMNAWLYDENGWPSGFGGGLVNGLGPDYQQKYLRHEVIEAAEAAGKKQTIGFYTADGARLLGRKLPAKTTGKVLRCYYELNPYYVDNLDAKVVAEFIRVTHQHYYETLPEKMRSALRGIFTDEPQLSRNGLPWSFILEEEYCKEFHRELLNELPMLFLNLDGSAAMRIRFWDLCSRLFSINFLKQIHDWCDAHHWELTGHHVIEESITSTTKSNGAVMRQYRYFHVPGVDHLGRSSASETAGIQVVSSAAQFGQKQILTESFAMTGWGCHFAGMRWIYQQQMAMGINYLCPHLESYSLRGLRKRDYPASAFYHQPWWDDYAKLNDGFGRVGMLLAEGTVRTDVAVCHPASSVWRSYSDSPQDNNLDAFTTEPLKRLTAALLRLQIPHHYADEWYVAEAGSVKGKEFIIGKQHYKIVILPPLTNLSSKMAELLQEFHRKGGVILKVRTRSEDGDLTVDGVPARRAFRDWFDRLPDYDSEEAAANAAAELVPERVRVLEHGVPSTGVTGTWRDVRIDGRKGRIFFFAATAYHSASHLTIALPRVGSHVEVIDQQTGECRSLENVRKSKEYLSFEFTLAAAGSALFFVTDKSPKGKLKCRAVDPLAGESVRELERTFTVKSATPNLLTLDRCRYRVDKGAWQETEVINLQARLLALQHDCDVDLEFPFEIGDGFDFSKVLTLAVEDPQKFRFTLNGEKFEPQISGYLFDKAFETFALPQKLRPGLNVIGMSMRFTEKPATYQAVEAAKKFESEYNKLTFESELESIYLAGDFTVLHDGAIEILPRRAVRYNGKFQLGSPLAGSTVDGGDLLKSGLPFFCGKLTLAQEIELSASEVKRARFLRFRLFGANSCRVTINGHEAGARFWEPFAIECAPYLKTGKNRIELELTTSLRNLLGPHHLAEGESYHINTRSFNREINAAGRPAEPTCDGFCLLQFALNEPELAESVEE